MFNTLDEILKQLDALADPSAIEAKAKRFNITANKSLGIYQRDLNAIAKEIKRDNELAIALFETGIYEARILCSKLFKPKDLTVELMEYWVVTFENWEICDSFCMGLFAKSEWAVPKIREWASREAEFERRAAFATLAAYCMADKKAENDVFESFFPLIRKAATDERIYVKKAVNWALRNIGKRNVDLRELAIQEAEIILQINHPAAQWIAKDALKELQKKGLRMSDYPRAIYRP